MKFCSNCGTPLEDIQAKFCPACGSPLYKTESQPSQEQTATTNSAALITLCILTLIGSVLGIIKGLIVQTFYSELSIHHNREPFGYASALFNMGTLVGAAMMLNRLKAGYTVYMIFQCANIITVIFWALGYDHFLDSSDLLNPFLLLTTSVTVVPSLLFMALYTFMVRKQLH